ncbi:hypothetical protein K502DRAFT_341754 [Neoconidiobolus thromboides FSU 785]|nr:hypothetical protein K502DRAFT_341754 [Neoconidiobolus thromboides FSU 785]
METLEGVGDKNLNISCVKVYGLSESNRNLVETYVQSLYQCKTLNECLGELRGICGRLEALEIGQSFDLDLKKDERGAGTEVEIKIVPHKTLSISTGTEFGNGDGNLNASIVKRNLFGHAEKFEASTKYGTKTTSSFQFSLSRPVDLFKPENRLEFCGYQSLINNLQISSHESMNRALELKYRFLSSWGQHVLGYCANWRTIQNVGFNASMKVREQAGDSIKSGIYHHLLNELWEDPQRPSNGYSLSVKQELAGLKGDHRFIKNELSYRSLTEITQNWFIGLGLKLGLLYPLDKYFDKPIQPSHLADRFFLGNPTTLRGFRDLGLGDKDKNDVLGGDISWALGMSLLTPLPWVNSNKFKGHVFINGGGLKLINNDIKLIDQIKNVILKPSSTFGLGLIYYHSIVRLEFNYCLPLSHHSRDFLAPKFQLGFGIDFL